LSGKELIITAPNEKTAVEVASINFELDPTCLKAKKIGDGQYRVQIASLPGKLELWVHPDAMKVLITELNPPLGEGPAVDLKWVKEELEKLNVHIDIDEKSVRQVLEKCQRDNEILKNIIIAKGYDAIPAKDAKCEIHFEQSKEPNCKSFAMVGDVLITKHRATTGSAGKDVFGTEIEVQPGKDIPVEAGNGVEIRSSEEKDEYVAKTYGSIQFENNKLEILSPVSISRDLTEAKIVLASQSCRGTKINEKSAQKALQEAEIVPNLLTKELLEEIKKLSSEKNVIKTIVAAEASSPKDGKDSRFERLSKNTEGVVKKGQILGSIVPPTKAQAGSDVKGGAIPGKDGREVPLEVSKNIELEKLGDKKIYKTQASGFIKFEDNKINLSSLVEISKDGMKASFDFYPKMLNGKKLEPDFVKTCLAEEGVHFGTDEKALQTSIAKIEKTGMPLTAVVVAKGQPEKEGKDGYLEKKWIVPGKENQKAFVKKGDCIAILHPPTEGKEGSDVLGTKIPARSGRSVSVAFGDGIEEIKQENTATSYRAASYGWISEDRDRFQLEWPLQISDDEMEVRGSLCRENVFGKKFQPTDIVDALKEQGIIFGVKNSTIESFLKSNDEKPLDEDFLFANGLPAKDSLPEKLQLNISFNNATGSQLLEMSKKELTERRHLDLVKAGQVLAKLPPATKGQEGKSVFGKSIPSSSPEATEKLETDSSIEFDVKSQSYLSKLVPFGYADFKDKELKVIDPIKVAEDKLSASLSIYPPNKGKAFGLTEEVLLQFVDHHGFKSQIEMNRFEEVVEKVMKSNTPLLNEPIIFGVAPKNGRDEVLSILIKHEQDAGERQSQHRIDYKERGAVTNVKKGEKLVLVTKATEGSAGFDIFGQSLPARQGDTLGFNARDNVEVVETETSYEYTASINGTLIISRDGCSVYDIFYVNSDVDYSTGHIRNDEGAVQVSGSVRSGFEVSANGDAIVEGLVEDATINGQKRVIIKGGLIGSKACVRAEGSVDTTMVNQATIITKDKVHVDTECYHSHIYSDDSIIIENERGRAVGGVLSALNLIHLPHAGNSKSPTKTKLQVGKSYATEKFLQELREQKIYVELEKCREEMNKISNKIEKLKNSVPVENEGEEKPVTMGSLLARLQELEGQQEALLQEEEEMKVKVLRNRSACVEVTGTAHQGAEIEILGYKYHVTHPLENVRFRLDSEADEIVVDYLVHKPSEDNAESEDQDAESESS